MKVAHLISQFYPVLGGAEICVHNICSSLAAAGHEATVVTTIAKPAEPPPVDYQIVHLSNKTNGLFRRFPWLARRYLLHSIAKLQKANHFDLWQVTMGYPLGAYAVEFFKRNHIPCVLRCCGEDIQRFPEINYGYRLDPKVDQLTRATYPSYDKFVALTPSVRDEYLDMGVREDKIAIIPNGVDTKRFAAMPPNPEIKRRYGGGDQTRLIISVGRHHPKKGYDLIPDIAAELKKRGRDFIWLIIGRGHEEFNQKHPNAGQLGVHTVETNPTPDDDAFSLPPSSLIELYRSADVFAFPTLLETFGMVLVEAMAAGLPIVTTDAPGVRDVVRNDNEGLRAPAGDAKTFLELLDRVLTDNQLAAKYSETSLKRSKRYDWSVILGEYMDLYQSLRREKKY